MARRPSRQTSSRGPLTPGPAAGTPLPPGPIPTDHGVVEISPDRDNPRALTLLVNGAPSSYVDLDDPRDVGFEYMEIMCAVIDGLPPGGLDAVHLGAAGCAMARWIDDARPDSRQIGIDIDGRLLELVREWFALPRAPRLRLRTGDARAQLSSLRTASADVVIRDVFAGDRTPDHLATHEFVLEVLRVLRPGGVYLLNCADRPPLQTARSEVATLRSAHADHVSALGLTGTTPADLALISEPALLKGRRYGNLVLAMVAPTPAESGTLLGSASLARRLRALAVPAHILDGAELERFARQAPVLRDPFGPAAAQLP